MRAVRAFAGELFASGTAGEEADRHRRLASDGAHPDLIVIEPEGQTLRIDEATRVITEAFRSPIEADRKVVAITQFHTAEPVVTNKLLKTIEEPPAATTIILLAEEVKPDQITVQSRCLTVPFVGVPPAAMASWLASKGVAEDQIDVVVTAAAGDLQRAELLVADEAFGIRRAAWLSVPDRLDGTGSAVVQLTSELRQMIDDAQEPLDARQAVEAEELDRVEKDLGPRAGARKAMIERHKREQRRHRNDELRLGLMLLAGAYRDRVTAADDVHVAQRAMRAIDRLRETTEALQRNPIEDLLLHALFLDL